MQTEKTIDNNPLFSYLGNRLNTSGMEEEVNVK